ncbi:hypothetical protein DFQ28_010773, partial [Apophysomyces sp. BC1034]
AVSEYKWVRLQDTQGTKLSLLEMYDACTRGVGGVIRVVSLVLRFDLVLLPAIVFQLGLIAIGPASQQILTSSAYQLYSCENNTALMYNDVDLVDMVALRTNNYDMRYVKGLQFDHFGQIAMQQGSYGMPVQYTHACSNTASNCTYTDIDVLHTVAECQPGNFDTPILNHHTMTVEPIRRSLGFNDSNPFQSIYAPQLPLVLYAPSMLGRTWWDLNNLTALAEQRPGSSNSTARSIRSYLGDQSFVAATYKGSGNKRYADNTTTVILQCTLRSYKNSTTIVAENSTIATHVTGTTPIDIDLDWLANPGNLRGQFNGVQHLLMYNAYGTHMTTLNTLIAHDSNQMQDNAQKWWQRASDGSADGSFQGFLQQTLRQLNTMTSFLMPLDPEFMYSKNGRQCTVAAVQYHANPTSYYVLMFSLLIPLIWWIVVWSIGLYKSNGISRGTSQIALLVTGLTDSAREHFQGSSHAGQNELLSKANQLEVVFGETRAGADHEGHVAFGLKDEKLRPIRARRTSMDFT